jgi:hypothetical protein
MLIFSTDLLISGQQLAPGRVKIHVLDLLITREKKCQLFVLEIIVLSVVRLLAFLV